MRGGHRGAVVRAVNDLAEVCALLREIRNLLLEDSLGPVQEAGWHDPADIDRIGAGAKGQYWPAVPE